MNDIASADNGIRATIWQELDNWAREFKPWQRYILCYLVREGQLSEERLDEAYTLILSEHGLRGPGDKNIEIPPSITGRPVPSVTSAAIRIIGIGNLTSVNALPSGAELTFSPALTVIYGPNGAGKSGFARIFSNVCFSRAQHKLLPDVNQDGPQPDPSADILFGVPNQTPTTFKFDGKAECQELKTIAVFDTAVARVHLAPRNALGFKPVGFDIFPEMAKCYGELSRRIDGEVSARRRDNLFARSFIGPETRISKLVLDLSHDIDLSAIRDVATFGPMESRRLEEVQRQLSDIQAKSIPQAIEELRQGNADFEVLQTKLKSIFEVLNEGSRERYRVQLSDLIYRNRVALEQGAASFKNGYLKSIGSYQWEDLIIAASDARKFEDEDYPRPGDSCLLCQQPLDGAAHALIHRIWEFLASEAKTKAREAASLLSNSATRIEALDFDFFSEATTCHAHMMRLNPVLAERVSDLIETVRKEYYIVHAVLCDACSIGRDGEIPTQGQNTEEATNVITKITEQCGQLLADIAQLQSQNPEEALTQLRTEKVELTHRQTLNQIFPDIENFVNDLLWIDGAGIAKRSLNPRSLTNKETELFERVVAKDYRLTLRDECKGLSCALPIEIKTEGERGRTLRSLSVKGGYPPEQIFSEGEQRAIALADFLTEIALNPANAGIILDDPVTSQDHYRKNNIAIRLVAEAKSRQVIILTHDLVFLTMLAAQAVEQELDILTHWIERDAQGRPGQISLDDSPATTPQYRDTKKAKATLAEAKLASGSTRIKLVQRGMAELRRTIEEMVPHFLLKQAVNRWTDRIIVTALKKVNWDADLVADIIKAFEELSGFIEGHSHTEQAMGAPAEPMDLQDRITEVEFLIRRAKADKVTL